MPELTIGWVDNATDNTSQNIYRSEGYIEEGALPAPVASVGADLAVYADATVQDDRCYFYRVGTVSPVGEVVSSQLISAATENLWVSNSTALATITALSAHYGAMSPSASRSAMGADFSDGSKWAGGVLGPDGKIYGIPYNSPDILVIDPVAGTATRTTMGADLTGSSKWSGGARAPNGKIYGIPLGSANILVIDPAAGTASRLTMGAYLSGTWKWYTGVLAPDGKIYAMPLNSLDLLVIDPVADTATRTVLDGDFSGTSKWVGGVLAPNGVIYGVPFGGLNVLALNFNMAEALPTKLICSPPLNQY